jgi:hypothetical protein
VVYRPRVVGGSSRAPRSIAVRAELNTPEGARVGTAAPLLPGVHRAYGTHLGAAAPASQHQLRLGRSRTEHPVRAQRAPHC